MRRVTALAVACLPLASAALEPRFDHRDQWGPAVEVLLASDTLSPEGGASSSKVTPALRLSWGFDPVGEGNEVQVGARLSWPEPDPEEQHVRAAVDVRYRAYFGTEEWKTFLDFGILASAVSRLTVGPLLGLGVQYDLSRSGGFFAAACLGTGFGEARLASLSVSAGGQYRF